MISNSRLHTRQSGFTLIETIAVLLIISITAALIIPRVGAGWKRIEDSDFLQQFVETIKRARLNALSSGRTVAFRLNGPERLYGFDRSSLGSIPLNAQIFSEKLEKDPESGDFMIIFFPDGSFLGKDLEVVFDQTRRYQILIHPLFGTVDLVRASG